MVTKEEYEAVTANDDLTEIQWPTVEDAYDINLPFRHNDILRWSGYIQEKW